jgi:hypothetical protein
MPEETPEEEPAKESAKKSKHSAEDIKAAIRSEYQRILDSPITEIEDVFSGERRKLSPEEINPNKKNTMAKISDIRKHIKESFGAEHATNEALDELIMEGWREGHYDVEKASSGGLTEEERLGGIPDEMHNRLYGHKGVGPYPYSYLMPKAKKFSEEPWTPIYNKYEGGPDWFEQPPPKKKHTRKWRKG